MMQRRVAVSLMAALALALIVQPRHADAQGMPVFKEGTKASPTPWPGDPEARYGVQILVVGPDSLRALLGGNRDDGMNARITNPPQGVLAYHPTVIQSVGVWPAKRPVGKTAQVDSCPPMPTYGATRWELWIQPQPDDSTSGILFAVQVRKHRVESGDSLSTFAWQPQNSSGAGLPDTLGSVLWTDPRSSATDTLCYASEFPMFVSGVIQPRGRAVPLRISGQDVGAADYISIRVRPLKEFGLGSNGAVWGSLQSQLMSYKISLIGYYQ